MRRRTGRDQRRAGSHLPAGVAAPRLDLSGFVDNLKMTTSLLIPKEFTDEVAKAQEDVSSP
jgi:hypothetical protein